MDTFDCHHILSMNLIHFFNDFKRISNIINLPHILFICQGCSYGELIGNGFCNDETNDGNCYYDGGDCCGINVNKDHCITCSCKSIEACKNGSIPASVGDGFCNDENNNEDCMFDGLDCCGINVNKDYCVDCSCHGTYNELY